MKRFLAFWKQPLNQGALAAAAGFAMAVLQGSMSWQHAVPLAIGALVALAIPDNSVAKEDLEVLIADAIKAAQDLQKGSK